MVAVGPTMLLIGFTAACSGGDDEVTTGSGGEEASACDRAFASAAAVGNMRDTHSDLWPAFDACRTVTEFTGAAESHPGAIDADPAVYAENQCYYEPEVADSALCAALE